MLNGFHLELQVALMQQVVIENIKLGKELEERKAARKMAADICRSGKPLQFPSQGPQQKQNGQQSSKAQTKQDKKRKAMQPASQASPSWPEAVRSATCGNTAPLLIFAVFLPDDDSSSSLGLESLSDWIENVSDLCQ